MVNSGEIEEMDLLRAAEYGMLAVLLGAAPTADVLRQISGLKGDVSALGLAHIDLANAEELRDRLLDCLDRFDDVEVDLGGVTFIDSTGLGALVRLRTEAATRGKTSALSNLSPATERILQLSGLLELFTIKPALS